MVGKCPAPTRLPSTVEPRSKSPARAASDQRPHPWVCPSAVSVRQEKTAGKEADSRQRRAPVARGTGAWECGSPQCPGHWHPEQEGGGRRRCAMASAPAARGAGVRGCGCPPRPERTDVQTRKKGMCLSPQPRSGRPMTNSGNRCPPWAAAAVASLVLQVHRDLH
jgi:hypothetical protein